MAVVRLRAKIDTSVSDAEHPQHEEGADDRQRADRQRQRGRDHAAEDEQQQEDA